jgi:hypothetical protein
MSMQRLILWILAGWFLSCSQARRPDSAVKPMDMLLPSGQALFLFDFSQSRYQKWPSQAVADTLRGDWAASSHWLVLSSPGFPFTPIEAIGGPNGNFFLLDKGGKRLCLYDTNAQFLSSLSLPQEIRDRNLDRFQVFWTRDGLFSFLDRSAGLAWQFAEMRSQAGNTEWNLRNRLRLPLGLQSCIWEPFSRDLCCTRMGGDAAPAVSATGASAAGASAPEKGAQCFDKYFNPTGPWPGKPPESGSAGSRMVQARLNPGDPGWLLALSGPDVSAKAEPDVSAKAEPICFSPDKGTLSTCPAP